MNWVYALPVEKDTEVRRKVNEVGRALREHFVVTNPTVQVVVFKGRSSDEIVEIWEGKALALTTKRGGSALLRDLVDKGGTFDIKILQENKEVPFVTRGGIAWYSPWSTDGA